MSLKTSKSVLKRFKITKNKKFLHKPQGQNHFKAKDSGSKTRAKRHMKTMAMTDGKNIKNIVKSLPYI